MERYAAVHASPQGPGDARPTAEQIIKDQNHGEKLAGKTVLITGGTARLGTETARVLNQTGAKIFITARSAAKGEVIARSISKASPTLPAVEIIEMELSSLTSVSKAAQDFISPSNRLNSLITNAGVMACPESKTEDDFELQFQSNHLSHFLLF